LPKRFNNRHHNGPRENSIGQLAEQRELCIDGVLQVALAKIQLGNLQNTVYTKFTLFDLNGNRLGTVSDFTVPENYPKGTYIIRAEAKGLAAITKKVAR
jgi:hypothetical protein